MKTLLLTSTIFLALSTFAQCPQVDCPSDITVYADSSGCDAIVNFTTPSVLDTCNIVSSTFNYTGTEQSFIVPNGVTSIHVDAYGAQGGSLSASNVNYGGRVEADIPVTPGQTIYVYVGEQPTTTTGGFNGGGNGETAGIGGGGASDIRIGGNTLNDRVVVAGGAGGGGFWNGEEIVGGLGGGLIGGAGYRTSTANPGGDPGTQTTSGNGTCVSINNPSVSGGFGFGGAPSGCGCEGYGGGGGWYGGAGSGNCRGGGGGSSYTIPSASNVVHTQGIRAGDGEVIISYFNSTTTSVSQISGLTSGSTFPFGASTVEFEGTSGGNADTCSFVVNVVDTLSPMISAPTNVATCDSIVTGIAPTMTWDNCSIDSIYFLLTGATAGGGINDASGFVFNPGTTTVTYFIMDGSGNTSSATFDVTVTALPNVSLAAFTSDSLCSDAAAIMLPSGTPAGGTYSGTGVSGGMFDPALSGAGTFWVTYEYQDSVACAVNSDSTAITILDCASLDEAGAFSNISVSPNPTTNNFELNTPGTGAVVYTLYSSDGKVLLEGKTSKENTVLEMDKHPTGVYMLHLSKGNRHDVIKLIKQ